MRRLRRQCDPQVLRVRRPDVRGDAPAGPPRRAGSPRGEAAVQIPRLLGVRRRPTAGREGRRDHLPRRVPGAGDHARRAGGGPDGRESPRSGHRGGVCGRRHRPVKRPIAELWGTGSYTPERVLEETGLTPLDLDAVVVATCSPDRLLPSQACDLQAILGAKNAAAFDVGAACTGFLYALNVAAGLVAAEQARHVLVVASEKLTSIMDWTDRTTAVLFGDGAGATVVRKSDTGRGILSSFMKSDGTLAELLYRPGGGAAHPPDEALLKDHSYYIKMAGREVFKAAVLSMADACATVLTRAGLSAADIDLLIPHQANIRIIEATAKHAGVPMDKVYVNVDRFGNTSAASIAIALDEAVKTGRLKPGMVVMLCAFGAGFTWGSMVVRW